MDVRTIATETHGRVLVEAAASGRDPVPWLVAFHGYGQSADDALGDVMKIPGIGAWNVAAVQGLNRFYTRRDERVVASWMTRQDREQTIADNVAYIDRMIAEVARPAGLLVYLGFSQGAAMAYRAAMLGRRPATGIVALAGDVPPELKAASAPSRGRMPEPERPWPSVLIGAGREEQWYTEARCSEDETALRARNAPVQVVRFQGGHEWTIEFREAVAAWLADLADRQTANPTRGAIERAGE